MSRDDAIIEKEAALERLKFRPNDESPSRGWAVFQTLLALAVIFVSSKLFVDQLEALSPALGLSPQLTALLLSPIATELPETMNAIIWTRQGKVTLALGNISGAMMIQATIPSVLGIIFTPWMLDSSLVIAAVVTFLSISMMWALLRSASLGARKLAAFGLLYLIFVAAITWQ